MGGGASKEKDKASVKVDKLEQNLAAEFNERTESRKNIMASSTPSKKRSKSEVPPTDLPRY